MAVPYLPACDGMPSNKRRLVYDITACMTYSSVEDYVRKAVKKGWHDVLVAMLYQGMDTGRVERALMHVVDYDTPPYRAAQAAVIPHLDQVSTQLCGKIAGKLLVRPDETVKNMVLHHAGANGLAECARLQIREGQMWKMWGVIDLCLRHGGDIHYNNGILMKWAASNNDLPLMDHLVEQGFDLRLYQTDLERHLQETTVPHTARVHMTALLSAVTAAPALPAPAMPVAPAVIVDGGYLRSGDCVSRVDALPGGGSLTTVFNFATCQQIVIAHVAGQTGQPAVVPFDAIPHDAALQDAARAFVQQGGAPQRVYAVTMASPARAPLIGKAVVSLPKNDQP